ncbi:zinc finger protein 436-like isoform X1 [Ornithodoros turicata]|uniref:zinc finger protein 436-like isoform X1 n=1 Tax=Ornithodoros turicata TaxID=34597 RepID=UPI003138EDB4
MLFSLEFRDQPVRVKSEPPDVACLPQQGQVHQQHCGVTAGTCDIKEEPREESSKEHAIVEVKTEPYHVTILTGQDQMGRKCDSTSEGVTAGTCPIKEEPREESSNEDPIIEVKTEAYNVPVLAEEEQMCCDPTSEGATVGMCDIKEEPREESSQEDPNIEVKTEAYNVVPLGGQEPMRHRCDPTSEGATLGICHIKDEHQVNCSNEHQIVQVKTEPYNVALLAEKDEMGHSCLSASEGARGSTGLLHINDQPRGTCDQASSGCTSSEAQFNISTITIEAQFDNTSPVTMDSPPMEQPRDQSKPCALACTSKDSRRRHMLAQCHNESEKCPATPSGDQMAEEGFRYDICPSAFLPSGSDTSHVSKRTDEESCKSDHCPAQFHQRRSLRCHMQTHMNQQLYKNDTCSVKFSRIVHRRLRKRAHTREKLYKCDACPAEFSRTWHLQRHKRTHRGEKPNKCDLCPAEFSQSKSLLDHKLTHMGEKTQKFNVCPAEFSRRRSFQNHKWTHTSKKPYKCDACPAKFSHNEHLQRHKRTHTSEKPYKCDACPAAFSERGNLHQHKRTHTGEKPYKCDVCQAKFSQSGHLQRHKQTHKGEKPYKCDLCPAGFSKSKSLSDHKLTHTGEKP